jgi:transposase
MSGSTRKTRERAVELTMKEKQRIEVVQGVLSGRLTVLQAAEILRRCERTVFRMCRRLEKDGLTGLVHGNKGRVSPRRMSESARAQIMELVSGKYSNVNDTHLCELLAKHEKLQFGRETLRRLLRGAGVKAKRKRRSPRYRSRRERKAAFGMMLQLDASPHDWLEGRGPWLTLVGAIDDATNHRWVCFVPAETTWSYLDLMREVITAEGLPLSLYADKHSIFHVAREPTIVEQLRGEIPLTQFGRAMHELGISIIPAHSPQAKGRIERQWGFLQDRLVVELRLANATTMDEANAVLRRVIEDYNAQFCVPPRQATSVFRRAPAPVELDRILCLKEQRVVNKDHTISFQGLVLQIPPSKHFQCIAGRTIDVLQQRDGTVEILYRGHVVARFGQAAVTRLIAKQVDLRTELRAA